MELTDYLEKVKDEASFLQFASALRADKLSSMLQETKSPSAKYDRLAGGWENTTIEGFLESAIAWAEDSDFGESLGYEINPWKKFALFLYCGKIYE